MRRQAYEALSPSPRILIWQITIRTGIVERLSPARIALRLGQTNSCCWGLLVLHRTGLIHPNNVAEVVTFAEIATPIALPVSTAADRSGRRIRGRFCISVGSNRPSARCVVGPTLSACRSGCTHARTARPSEPSHTRVVTPGLFASHPATPVTGLRDRHFPPGPVIPSRAESGNAPRRREVGVVLAGHDTITAIDGGDAERSEFKPIWALLLQLRQGE